MYVYIYVYVYVCMHIYMCMYTHMYVYTHILIYAEPSLQRFDTNFQWGYKMRDRILCYVDNQGVIMVSESKTL